MNNLFKYLLISAALLLLTLNTSAQIKSGSVTIGSGTTQMDMTIAMNTNTSEVSFSITGPASRWFAYGLGSSTMSGSAYTIVANVSSSIPKEYNQANHAAPILQTIQDLNNMVSINNGATKTYTFTRAMNTGDVNDYVFTNSTTTINLIWAYGSSTTMAQHASRGTSSITLSNICNIPVTNLQPILICQGDSAMIFGSYENTAANYWDTLQTAIGCDSVLMQSLAIGQDFNSPQTDTNLCFGDSIQLFGKWVSQAGIYYDSLTSIYGCDSINSVRINVIQIDTQVYVSNNKLYAAYAFADHYQWYDCQNAQAIAGANSLSYQPLQNGSYQVEISNFNCIARSSCHTVNWTGINSMKNEDVSLSPNPVNDKLKVKLPYENQLYQFEIYTIDGRKLKSLTLTSSTNIIDLSKLKSGMYIYKIRNNNNYIKTGRFIKN